MDNEIKIVGENEVIGLDGLTDEELDGLLTFMGTAFDSYVGWNDLDIHDAALSMKMFFQAQLDDIEEQAVLEMGL